MPHDDGDGGLSRRQSFGFLSAAAVGAAMWSHDAAAQPSESVSPADANLRGARVYNVRDFGATGDGATLDSDPVQRAIDACHGDGGGTRLPSPWASPQSGRGRKALN